MIDFVFIVLAFGFSLACGVQTSRDLPSNGVEPLAEVSQAPTPEPSPDMSSVRKNCRGTIWSGTVGGKSVVWTGDDVFLISRGRKQGLFRPSVVLMHRAGVETTISNLKYIGGYRGLKKNPLVKTLVGVEIMSVVDPVVTFEIETLSFLEGYPGLHNTWWLTLDLSKTSNIEPFLAVDVQNFDVSGMADLRTMFPKDDLFRAIIESPEVRQALDKDEGHAYVEFLKTWMDRAVDLSKREESIPVGRQGLSLIEYSFQHFVFDRIENEKIVVRLALVNVAASETYSNEYIEISLTIPGSIAKQFSLATTNVSGFLGKDRKRIADDCSTSLDLKTTIRR